MKPTKSTTNLNPKDVLDEGYETDIDSPKSSLHKISHIFAEAAKRKNLKNNQSVTKDMLVEERKIGFKK